MKTIVVVPVRNEQDTILATLEQLDRQVIVADGHSTDQSATLAKKWGAKVVPSEGTTYGDAVLTGMKQALAEGAEIVVVMDCESHTFKDMVPYLEGDWDILAGVRTFEYKGFWRKLLSRFGRLVNEWAIGSLISDPTSGFRAYRRNVAEAIVGYLEGKSIPSYAFNYAVAMHPALYGHELAHGWAVKQFPMSYKVGNTGMTRGEAFKAAIWVWRHQI